MAAFSGEEEDSAEDAGEEGEGGADQGEGEGLGRFDANTMKKEDCCSFPNAPAVQGDGNLGRHADDWDGQDKEENRDV